MMTIMVENSGANVVIKFCVNEGMLTSQMSMSLEKRLTIRPRGVVSKNAIVHFSMLCSNRLCKVREAAIAPYAMEMARPKTANAVEES